MEKGREELVMREFKKTRDAGCELRDVKGCAA